MMNVRNGMQRTLNKVSKLISNTDQPTLVFVVLVIVLVFTIIWKFFLKKVAYLLENKDGTDIMHLFPSFPFLSCTISKRQLQQESLALAQQHQMLFPHYI